MFANNIDLYGLVDSLNIGVIVLDKYNNIIFSNKETLNIFNLGKMEDANDNLVKLLYDFKLIKWINSNTIKDTITIKYSDKNILVCKRQIEKELNLYKDEFKKSNKAKYALDSIISESESMKRTKEVTKKSGKN